MSIQITKKPEFACCDLSHSTMSYFVAWRHRLPGARIIGGMVRRRWGPQGARAPGVSEKGSVAVQLYLATSNTAARCCALP